MKKSLSIVLLVFLFALACGCSARNDMAAAEVCDVSNENAIEDYVYSMGRAVNPGDMKTDEDGTDTASGETAADEEIPLVYIMFTQQSYQTLNDYGSKVFVCQYYEPEFVTEDDTVNEWLASEVKTVAQSTAQDIARVEQLALADSASREEEDLSFYSYSYYSDITTERIDSAIISILQVNSAYSGGAHPNYAQQAYNLDLTTMRRLSLTDIIEPGGEAVLMERVLAELQSRFGGLENLGLFPDYRQVVEDCFDGPELTANWYFGDNGLNIYFNCYEIAPFAAGIIKVEFDYDSLIGVLRTDYFPASVEAGEGSAILLNNTDNRRILTVPSDGERFCVGADRVIYDVSIQRITSWLADNVPNVGPMVFSANRLTLGEAVELGDSGTTAAPMYLVSYRDGTGVRHTVAVGTEIIREIVAKTAE